MSENAPNPPQELINEGEAWAREQFLFESRDKINTFLQSAFIGGMRIFDAHRDEVRETLEQHGGFKSVRSRLYTGRSVNSKGSVNSIECNDGAQIPASALLTRKYVVEQLPAGSGLPANAEQHFLIYVSFGGSSLGIKPEEALESDRKDLLALDLSRYLDADFYPEDVLLTESILTSYTHPSEEQSDLRERHYSINALNWTAKLRPEFGGTLDSPEIKMTDMIFTATGTLESRWKEWQTYQGMKTFIDRHGGIKDEHEAVEKLYRFYELLRHCHQETVGEDLDINMVDFEAPGGPARELPRPLVEIDNT